MKYFTLVLLFLSLSTALIAQEDELVAGELLEPKITFDFDFRGALTTGEFNEFYKDEGMGGVGLTVLAPISRFNPIDLGVDFGYFYMSGTEATYNYTDVALKEHEITSSVTGSMIPIHAVIRIYPIKNKKFPIQPYVEGVGGVKLFVINHTIETESKRSDLEMVTLNDPEFTSAWSYGYGAGFKMRISKTNLLYFNTKVDHMFGMETDYINPTSYTQNEEGKYLHQYNSSMTDILQFSVGLHLMIE